MPDFDDFFNEFQKHWASPDRLLPHFDWSADNDMFAGLDDWSAVDKMFAHLDDWSTLDAMFPAQDQIVDKLFQPIDKAMGKKRSRRVGKRRPRRTGGKPR